MTVKFPTLTVLVFVLQTSFLQGAAFAQSWQAKVTIDWDKVERVSKTVPTYQIVESARMRPTSPIHDSVYRNLHDLGAEYVRFQAWFPFPKLAVAELEPPHDGKAYWDFSHIDPIVVDFLKATQGHKIIMNLATIPEWMFKTPSPVPYPADPDEVDYKYSEGTELRDQSMKEVADYFAHLASWYIKGGFTDEYGHRHESGHHFKIDYWEILNEVEGEHRMTPETYTALYDAVAEAIQRLDPQMKFVGMALARVDNPRFFEYFLNPGNHKRGIPLDMISYHFYAHPGADEDSHVQQFTVFEQAQRFLIAVKYIEAIRQRLSPQTRTTLNELGIIAADDRLLSEVHHVSEPIPDSYWNLSAALFAFIYNEVSHLGIEAAGMSSGLGYPNFYYPSVTMMDWNTGQPNARYWALKLLIDNSGPGDKQVATQSGSPFVVAQAYIDSGGKRKILLANKRDRPFEVSIPGIKGATEEYVDQNTNFHPAASRTVETDEVVLGGFAVCILTLR